MELFPRSSPGPIERFIFRAIMVVAVLVVIRGIIALVVDVSHLINRVEVVFN